jgi:hypothetical protein
VTRSCRWSLRTPRRLELLRLAGAASAASEPTERNALVVLGDVAEVSVRLRELQAYEYSRVIDARAQGPESHAPLTAAATSRMFLKCVRRYSP